MLLVGSDQCGMSHVFLGPLPSDLSMEPKLIRIVDVWIWNETHYIH